MICKVKQPFYLGARLYKPGDSVEFTEEQTTRLQEYIEPGLQSSQDKTSQEEKSLDEPVKDKMIKTKKILKKGK